MALLLLEFGLLVLNHETEKLALEARAGDGEVHLRDDRCRGRGNDRVRVTRHQVHPERLVVIDRLVTHLNHETKPLPLEIFADDVVENRFDFVNLLDDQRLAEANGELELVREALVVHRHNLQRRALVLGDVCLEPLARLRRGIDDEGSLRRVENDDCVLHRELIAGEALGFPRQHLALGRHEPAQVEPLHAEEARPLRQRALPLVLGQ